MSQQTQLRQCKHYHPQCIPGGLGPLETIRGFDEVSPEAQQQVRDFADSSLASRAQYVAAKRRRTVINGDTLGERGELQVNEDLDPDGAFEDDKLHHLDLVGCGQL